MSWAELWKEVFLMEGRLDTWLQFDPLEYLLAPTGVMVLTPV